MGQTFKRYGTKRPRKTFRLNLHLENFHQK